MDVELEKCLYPGLCINWVGDLVVETDIIAVHPYAASHNGSHKVEHHKESVSVFVFGFLGRFETCKVDQGAPGQLACKRSLERLYKWVP